MCHRTWLTDGQSPKDVYTSAHRDAQCFRTVVSAVRALGFRNTGTGKQPPGCLSGHCHKSPALLSSLSFASITQGGSVTTLQSSYSVPFPHQIDKNKSHFPKKTDKSFPNQQVNGLVWQCHGEVKQLLFCPQLFQQLLAWPWWVTWALCLSPSRPDRTRTLLLLFPATASSLLSRLIKAILAWQARHQFLQWLSPMHVSWQLPMFAFFIRHNLGQGAPYHLLCRRHQPTAKVSSTQKREAVNERSAGMFSSWVKNR